MNTEARTDVVQGLLATMCHILGKSSSKMETIVTSLFLVLLPHRKNDAGRLSY